MSTPRRILVFGASGFIGRWLTKELLEQGAHVTIAMRSRPSSDALLAWLAEQGLSGQPSVIHADMDDADLGLTSPPNVTEIFNAAGTYRFGMSPVEARSANVDTARRVVELAAHTPGLVRLVHVSGYRVGGSTPNPEPWSARDRATRYRRDGAYEASKAEADAVVRATAHRLGVPLTIANPGVVIGDSRTGETSQRIGLAATILQLLARTLPALVGNSRTFVPVVTVDYLATFLALLPMIPEAVGRSYWVLDDRTPPLPAPLQGLAEDLGVRAPRFQLPASIVRALPSSWSGADAEMLAFLSSDRYPHQPATHLAVTAGLTHPDIARSLSRWAAYLQSTA